MMMGGRNRKEKKNRSKAKQVFIKEEVISMFSFTRQGKVHGFKFTSVNDSASIYEHRQCRTVEVFCNSASLHL